MRVVRGRFRGWRGALAVPMVMVLLLVGAACSQGAEPAGEIEEATPAPALVDLDPIFSGHVFERAVDIGSYPGDRLYVATLDGRILLGEPDVEPTHVLADLTEAVGTELEVEQGLLSVALDPQFTSNGYMYVYYSPGGEALARLSRLTVVDDVAAASSELEILRIDKPYLNHHGGTVLFGTDGMLYLSIGDGGGPSDPAVNRRGQELDNLMGTVVRLDVRESSAAEPYRIPLDNPFVDDPDARSEIWAYGFRNPWRMAVDALTGALWLGDVGENRFEEVNHVVRGGNYGWNDFEGYACFPEETECDLESDVVWPVHAYARDEGCSISGGVVYRGSNPLLHGRFLYSDWCSGTVWGIGTKTLDNLRLIDTGRTVTGVSEDENGEAYLLAFDSPVLRLTPLMN